MRKILKTILVIFFSLSFFSSALISKVQTKKPELSYTVQNEELMLGQVDRSSPQPSGQVAPPQNQTPPPPAPRSQTPPPPPAQTPPPPPPPNSFFPTFGPALNSILLILMFIMIIYLIFKISKKDDKKIQTTEDTIPMSEILKRLENIEKELEKLKEKE